MTVAKPSKIRRKLKAVIDEIVRRLQDPVLANRSIGVVTFSSIQQNLIDDLLVEVFKENPELEEKAMTGEEPLFIKNLENVQGDERDVILFSVGYGPDEHGKLTLNFGPLNRDGGWRRLNVAVSRARYEMMVYSVIRPEQLDLSRTSSEGVAGLKAFLEYAHKGKQAMVVKAGEVHTGLAGLGRRIVSLLEQNGYAAYTDIGCSGYRVDVGIVHPHQPDEYILGIICDGSAYKNARTARDREILQFSVLRQLGWNIHKVWTLDWWENPDKELKKIIAIVEELLHAKKLPVDLPAAPSFSIVKRPEAVAQFNTPVAKLAANAGAALANPWQKEYVITPLPLEPLSADEFCQPENAAKIMENIMLVINTEAPISKNLLGRRVLQSFGIARMGGRLERYFGGLINHLQLATTTTGENITFWKDAQHAENLDAYRVAVNEADKRNAEDLPPEETANAVRSVLINQIGLPRVELIRETARTLGYHRIGKAVEPAMNLGIEIAIKRGWAAVDASGNVVLK